MIWATRCLNPYWCFAELAISAVFSCCGVALFVVGGAHYRLSWIFRIGCWIGCIFFVWSSWKIIHIALDYRCWFG